jgi:hypothetical protein
VLPLGGEKGVGHAVQSYPFARWDRAQLDSGERCPFRKTSLQIIYRKGA